MRIQHNIAAMNSYRQYANNTSAVAKNLEKLSSGYKINRAGDDAAGLAISEKMRAQITGLETAQKNAKDGISLVKTGEGALQEVHDMLNRMVTLATQSANGTYDNTTDRAQLQKEVDQLKTEINRIADSANFNGIKLLDGSMDADGRRVSVTTQYNEMKISNNVNGEDANGTSIANSKGGLNLTGSDLADLDATELDESDASVRYHKDAAVGAKTTFVVDLDGSSNSSFNGGTTISGLIFGLDGGQEVSNENGVKNNALWTSETGTAATDRLVYEVSSDTNGITSENIASSVMKAINDAGGKVYLTVGSKADNNQTRIEYSVTQEGDKLRFTMTDKGYNDAAKAAEAAKAANKGGNFFQGNFNVGINYKSTGITAGSDEETFTNFVNSNQTAHPATSDINEGTTPAGTIYAEALIRFDETDPDKVTGGINDINKFFKDGAGIKLGNDYYVFAQTDAVLNGEYADNVHVVDIRDLGGTEGTLTNTGAVEADDLRKALDRLSQAAADNEMFDVQVAKGGNALVVTERTTYNGEADLTYQKNFSGLESQIQKFDSVTSKSTVLKEAGRALTLQIGDTSEDFNQMKVNIKDIHTDSLGIDKMDISTQEGAQAAIDTIKAAINYVSDVRGTLGATQNRLEHTINNLSVMQENIQDAESTIRDTDIAQEMMAYTKNNILVQSAQAMLAQANQIPQGVLQLLG